MGALEKLIRETAWGALDVLFIDMPPGSPSAASPLRSACPAALAGSGWPLACCGGTA